MASHRPTASSTSSGPGPAPLVDEVSPGIKAAHGLWAKGRRTDALVLFEQAVRNEPRNVQAHVAAAKAYAECFDFARMDQALDRLVRQAPQHPGVHHYLGETLLTINMPDRALAAFRRAADLPGAGPPTWLELASLCERAHQLEVAEELVGRIVASGYMDPHLDLVKGRVERRLGKVDHAAATFRALAEAPGTAPQWSSQAWGELALICDAQGDFLGAIDAIGKCKAIQQRFEEPFLRSSRRTADALGELAMSLSRADLRRWRSQTAALPERRVALMTGFPRSGTTLLEQVLDAHPDLVSSEERDFGGGRLLRDALVGVGRRSLMESLNVLTLDDLVGLRSDYFASMEYRLGEAIGPRMHLDKNPPYNLLIPLLLRVFPEMRILLALRDPRDVVLSCYLRHLPLNAVSVHYLDVRRAAERYAADMTAWLRFREMLETPWIEVRYEDAVRDLEGQARRALAALELPWDEAVLRYRDRLGVGKRVTSPSYEAVAKPVYTSAVGRWRNYAQLMEPALETLAPFVREFGYAD